MVGYSCGLCEVFGEAWENAKKLNKKTEGSIYLYPLIFEKKSHLCEAGEIRYERKYLEL